MDLKEVVEEGAAWEEGMWGLVNERANKGDKKRSKVLPNNPIDGIGDSDGPELFRRG